MLVLMFRAAVKYMQVLVPSTAAFCRAKCELPFGLVVPPGKNTLGTGAWLPALFCAEQAC